MSRPSVEAATSKQMTLKKETKDMCAAEILPHQHGGWTWSSTAYVTLADPHLQVYSACSSPLRVCCGEELKATT